MYFAFNDEQNLLKESVERFVGNEYSFEKRSAWAASDLGYSRENWKQLAELGWLGLSLPAVYGGAQAPISQLGLLFEEAGHALAPVPLHPHTVASLTLAELGNADQKERYLADAATGGSYLSWAWSEGRPGIGPNTIQLAAEPDGNGWRLNGTKHFVDGFDGAAACIVAVRTSPGDGLGGISLVLLDPNVPGVRSSTHLTLAGDRQTSVTFQDVFVGGDDLLGVANKAGEAAQTMFEQAVILNCAMIVGATRRAVERAVEYAKERVAFGKAIGEFQAIQHMCANMITWVDGAELLTREALWKLSEGQDATLEIASAKAFANERCQAALREANQIHGGIAQVREYDQQLWYRRAAAWSMRLGTSLEHRKTVARCLGFGHDASP